MAIRSSADISGGGLLRPITTARAAPAATEINSPDVSIYINYCGYW